MIFNPILVENNGVHYLCTHGSDGFVSVYEIRLPTGTILYIDDWKPKVEFRTADEFRAYCEQAVKDNPPPF